MGLNKKNRYFMMILTLIVAFIAQPTLAASLSTQMQLATQMQLDPAGSNASISPELPAQQPMPMEHHEAHCPHSMTPHYIKGNTMGSDQAIADSPKPAPLDLSSISGQEDCLTTCQFCMSISCIIPENVDLIPNREAFIAHTAITQNPVSISHIPAHQPPRFYS